MSRCRSCQSPLEPFISFGPMPVANGFLGAEDFGHEAYFGLEAAFCTACTLVQLVSPVPPEKLFHGSYPFLTSSSAFMTQHFHRLGDQVRSGLGSKESAFVVEIGSNDGTLLQPLSAAGIRHLGVEPSANVAEMARAAGVDTLCAFFDGPLARGIVSDHGKADVILACNCFCHIADLHALAAGIRTLLKPQGVLVFEDPYVGDILRLTAYDQIYDEHVYYFSLAAVERWLGAYGLEVIDAQPQPVHGGSMRFTAARRGERRPAPSVARVRALESSEGLHRPETYARFRSRVERSRDGLVALLQSLRDRGSRVVGYGATSKSTTVLNYCGIKPPLLEFISDTTALKQGKFSPGAHVPVLPHTNFTADYPEFALLFAWNHAAEILAKEEGFRKAGGKWIRYIPEVEIF